MKVHHPKLYNMAHLFSLNAFTASKGSNNYILFHIPAYKADIFEVDLIDFCRGSCFTLYVLVLNFVLFLPMTLCTVSYIYEGGSESSVIGSITFLINMIGCCIIP